MSDTTKQISPSQKQNPEWVLMKCLVEAQRETLQAMEQHTFSRITESGQFSEKEIEASLKQARRNHERAIENIDASLSTLRRDF